MSQENVEIVKAWYDAFNREDWDAMMKDAAPGFELDLSRTAVVPQASSGWTAISRTPRNTFRFATPTPSCASTPCLGTPAESTRNSFHGATVNVPSLMVSR